MKVFYPNHTASWECNLLYYVQYFLLPYYEYSGSP